MNTFFPVFRKTLIFVVNISCYVNISIFPNYNKITFYCCIFRFALKRHRNIHEKYGRTKPQPPVSSNDDTQTNNTSTDSMGSNLATGNQEADHEEIVETKFEQKFETVDASEMAEEMTDISELQVQLQ